MPRVPINAHWQGKWKKNVQVFKQVARFRNALLRRHRTFPVETFHCLTVHICMPKIAPNFIFFWLNWKPMNFDVWNVVVNMSAFEKAQRESIIALRFATAKFLIYDFVIHLIAFWIYITSTVIMCLVFWNSLGDLTSIPIHKIFIHNYILRSNLFCRLFGLLNTMNIILP